MQNDNLMTRPPAAAYRNVHCHRRIAASGQEIVNFDTGDFNPLDLRGGYYSLGVHPWTIHGQDCELALQKISDRLTDPKLQAIGECGLDRCIALPLAAQLPVFISQLRLAEQAGKPLIIHGVRAFEEILALKKRQSAVIPWIIHGFNGKPASAAQLLSQNCYLSLGKALLNPCSNAARLLVEMPLTQLFLETDAEHLPISRIYGLAAAILGMQITDLQQLLLVNFHRVFFNE